VKFILEQATKAQRGIVIYLYLTVTGLPDLLFNLTAPTPLSLVGGPLSGNKRVWFTESHIIYVISLLLVALLTQFILNN
jgi:hypothetical protein